MFNDRKKNSVLLFFKGELLDAMQTGGKMKQEIQLTFFEKKNY